MADATLFVLSTSAPSYGPTIDLVRALVAQGLVAEEGFAQLVESDWVVALGRSPDEDNSQDLHDWVESTSADRFILVNVVMADAEGLNRPIAAAKSVTAGLEQAPHPALVRMIHVEQLIRDSLSRLGGRGVMSHQVLNLVIPAAAQHSIPDSLWWQSESAVWRNLLVAPETQRQIGAPMVRIDSNEDYVAHAVTSILTVTGLWVGAPGLPAFPVHFENRGPNEWTVVRTRSRSIVAPELPRKILGRVGRASRTVPVDRSAQPREFTIDSDPEGTAGAAFTRLVKLHRLDFQPAEPVTSTPPRPEKVKILRFLRILRSWLRRRLPQLAREMALQKLGELRDHCEKVLNDVAGLGPGSQLYITLGAPTNGSDSPGGAPPPLEEGGLRRRRRWTLPEPTLWSSVRSFSFGLLDGGDLDDVELERYVTDGNRRLVLGAPELIVPAPDVEYWVPSAEVADAVRLHGKPPVRRHAVDIDWLGWWESMLTSALMTRGSDGTDGEAESLEARSDGDPADQQLTAAIELDLARLRAKCKELQGSFHWRLAEHLRAQVVSSRAYLNDLEERLVKVDEETEEDRRKEETAEKRKRLRHLLISLAVVLVVGVALATGIWALALTGVILVMICVLACMVWLFGLFRSLWKWAYGRFLAEHRFLWLRKGHREMLVEMITFAELQCSRLENLEAIESDWADVISTMCFHPFGAPQLQGGSRSHGDALGLPSSHQIMEGSTSPMRLRSVIDDFVAAFIRPGWIGDAYASACSFASQPLSGMSHHRNTGFTPDQDTATDRTLGGDRSALVSAVCSGEARRVLELDIIRRIHVELRSGNVFGITAFTTAAVVDFLFTPDFEHHRRPSDYLAEVVNPENTEGVEFNATYFPSLRSGGLVGTVVHSTPLRPEAIDVPEPEALQLGVLPEFPPLVFTTWSLSLALNVKSESVLLLAGGDTPVVPAALDLNRARIRWVVPGGEPPGRIKSRPGPAGAEWVLDPASLPDKGSMLAVPAGTVPVAERTGPYAFLHLVNGEPPCWPTGSTIKVALRRDCAPSSEAIDLLSEALRRVATYTGYSFVFDGVFDGLPQHTSGRIEVGWAFEEEYRPRATSNRSEPSPRSIGVGGPGIGPTASGELVIVSATVLLNADMDYPVAFEPGECHGSVLLHELGHCMNLGHVNDEREIMNAFISLGPPGSELDYGMGDRLGLHEVGSGSLAEAPVRPSRLSSLSS